MVLYNSGENVAEVPLAFVSNTYLDELTASLRARPIPWEVRIAKTPPFISHLLLEGFNGILLALE